MMSLVGSRNTRNVWSQRGAGEACNIWEFDEHEGCSLCLDDVSEGSTRSELSTSDKSLSTFWRSVRDLCVPPASLQVVTDSETFLSDSCTFSEVNLCRQRALGMVLGVSGRVDKPLLPRAGP
eukprot:CAMPEP_0194509350 /NCGR_PEP_ID=MMETSP0253-20130528/40062_1 /TAXON_ID=2966 /ORGANISM="Noctiluca scintillans" /LENGTH=121 /DNA_ID=CAMNT_0039352497 /DNA_START=1 /DNA_END=366 /DNA_ORIENTATION=-